MSKNWDLFVTVLLLEETPAVLSFGKLCEDHGKTYQWTSGQKPHLTKNGKRIDGNTSKLCAIRSPWFIEEFLYNTHTYFFNIFITGFCIWRKQIQRKIQYSKEVEVWVRSYGETRCIDQQKTKTQIKKKRSEEVQRDLLRGLAELAAGVERNFGRWK